MASAVVVLLGVSSAERPRESDCRGTAMVSWICTSACPDSCVRLSILHHHCAIVSSDSSFGDRRILRRISHSRGI